MNPKRRLIRYGDRFMSDELDRDIIELDLPEPEPEPEIEPSEPWARKDTKNGD
jgi:hypothetical protein